ncbi:MAG: glycosyltransferase family 39 protein [Gammaproteobacteria bacterium]
MTSQKISSHWLKDLLSLTLLLGILFTCFLGSRPLLTPDEGRYVEIPREMVVSGDYLTPHLNGLKYFEKPPLFYWLETVPVRLFGIHEGGLRSVSVLLGIIGCLMVYAAGRILYTRRTGWLASLVLSTSLLYFVFAHLIIPDIVVSICLTGCLLAFILGTQTARRGKQVAYFWSMYAFAALAVLSKGLIGVIFPGMIIFAWLCLTRNWKQLKTYCIPTGLVLFLLIAAPWHILVQLKNPEFFQFYFIDQQFLRYFTDYADRGQPFWFFPATIFLGFFPWIFFFPWQLNLRLLRQNAVELFLVLWALLITLFFTFSHSLLISYALPVMPALALLTGRYLANIWSLPRPSGQLKLRFILIALGLLSIAIVGKLLIKPSDPVSWYLILGLLVLSAVATFVTGFKNVRIGILTLMVSFSFCLISINLSYKNLDNRSVKPLAQVLLPRLTADTPVVTYQGYFQDLPVYLQRRIIVAHYEGELAFGMAHQNTTGWVLSEQQFWNLWRTAPRAYAIMGLKMYHQLPEMEIDAWTAAGKPPLYPVSQTGKNILVTNRPL